MVETEKVNCPYCGADDSAPWASENGYEAVRCRKCGFVYVNPRPASNGREETTETGVYDTGHGAVNVVGRFHHSKVRNFERRLRDLFPDGEIEREPIRWLDVGSGFGELLLALQRLALEGSELLGVEPCRPKTEKARAAGVEVVEDLAEATESYQYVSLINVFSHLPDPAGFLRELRDKMTESGEIVLVTGNAADVDDPEILRPLYLPDHLVFAGERHVRGFLEKAGFEIVKSIPYREFLPQNPALGLAKYAVKRVLGRPGTLRQALGQTGSFRSLWVRARLRD